MNTNIIHQPFEEDGFVGPLNILTPHEARQALHQVQNKLSKENANRFKLHLFLPTISRIAHHPRLIDVVRAALDSNDIIYHAVVLRCEYKI
jgi:hypothetical protein